MTPPPSATPTGFISSLSSASGVLALLEEPDNQVKKYALETINLIVDNFWAEIADSISKM